MEENRQSVDELDEGNSDEDVPRPVQDEMDSDFEEPEIFPEHRGAPKNKKRPPQRPADGHVDQPPKKKKVIYVPIENDIDDYEVDHEGLEDDGMPHSSNSVRPSSNPSLSLTTRPERNSSSKFVNPNPEKFTNAKKLLSAVHNALNMLCAKELKDYIEKLQEKIDSCGPHDEFRIYNVRTAVEGADKAIQKCVGSCEEALPLSDIYTILLAIIGSVNYRKSLKETDEELTKKRNIFRKKPNQYITKEKFEEIIEEVIEGCSME